MEGSEGHIFTLSCTNYKLYALRKEKEIIDIDVTNVADFQFNKQAVLKFLLA